MTVEEARLSDNMIKILCEYRDYTDSQNGDGLCEVDKICFFFNPLHEISCIIFPALSKVFSTYQLMTVSSAEQIIDRGLRDGMSRKKYYKDIYQDVKKRVMTFAELHGQSEVIEQHLLGEGGAVSKL